MPLAVPDVFPVSVTGRSCRRSSKSRDDFLASHFSTLPLGVGTPMPDTGTLICLPCPPETLCTARNTLLRSRRLMSLSTMSVSSPRLHGRIRSGAGRRGCRVGGLVGEGRRGTSAGSSTGPGRPCSSWWRWRTKASASRAVQGVAALAQVGAGLLVLDVPVQAHAHAAEGVDDAHEAGEADLRVVVDAQPGVLLDGADQQFGAAVGEGRVQFVLPRPLWSCRSRVEAAGQGDPGVARQADHRGAVGAGVQQHHRVGAPPADDAGVQVLHCPSAESPSRLSEPTMR